MYCLHPVVIRNKKIYQYPDILCYYDGRKISPTSVRPSQVIIEDIDKYYAVVSGGEIVPMFLKVPCNKCKLCINKKITEWNTRAILENKTCSARPLFITLTYQDKYLPKYGVDKRQMQLFMKRLRINLERHYGKSISLRYVAASEYGTDDRYTCRPHYHLNIWNIPNETDLQLDIAYNMVAKSWSAIVDDKTYRAIPYKFLKFKEQLKTKIQYRELYGKIDVQRDEGYTTSYVTKYIAKGSYIPVDDPILYNSLNSTFILSSRRGGGIGMPYIKANASELRKKVTTHILLNIENKCHSFLLPRCAKDFLFPSLSKLVDSNHLYQLYRLKKLREFYAEQVELPLIPKDIQVSMLTDIAPLFDKVDKLFDTMPRFMQFINQYDITHPLDYYNSKAHPDIVEYIRTSFKLEIKHVYLFCSFILKDIYKKIPWDELDLNSSSREARLSLLQPKEVNVQEEYQRLVDFENKTKYRHCLHW